MSKQLSADLVSSCAFTYSDGRQCRMLPESPDSKYCVHHNRKLRHLHDVETIAFDLVQPISSGFVSATALTQSLSRILVRVAEGRIDPKVAIAMTRAAEALRKTIPLSMEEFRGYFVAEYYDQLVRRSFGKLPPYVPPAPGHSGSDDGSDSDQGGTSHHNPEAAESNK